ncbi:MAG: helix-turn-helix domain-containing protein [Patescibacteria group bacterium]
MKDLFKNLGIDEKGTEVFLKLLELGAQPVSVIAKFVGVPRPTMYLILDELKACGLVDELFRNGIKYYKCVAVKSLQNLFKVKESEIQYSLELFQEKLPELFALENKLSITPKVKFHEGKEAVSRMYEEVFGAKDFCAFFNPEMVGRIMPVYLKKIPEEIRRNRYKARELLVDSKMARAYKKAYNSSSHQIKILPKGMVFHSDTMLCKDRIFMVSYGENNISAVEIINKSLADTQKAMFEQLWKSL